MVPAYFVFISFLYVKIDEHGDGAKF